MKKMEQQLDKIMMGKTEEGEGLSPIDNKENIGTIDIVLIKMMKYLSSTDLVHFRLVNRQWRDQATSILLKRQDLSIDLVFCPGRNVYQMHDENYRDQQKINGGDNTLTPTLEHLVECIRGSKCFPAVGFEFSHGDWVRDGYQLEQFFRLYGKNIKKLRLNLKTVHKVDPSPLIFPIEIEEETTTEAWIKKLMKLIPNLKHLHIQSLPTEFWEFKQRDEDEEKGEKFVFSSLQILNLEGFKKIVDENKYKYIITNKKKNKSKKKNKRRNFNDDDDDTITTNGNIKYCGFLDLILKSATNLIVTENFSLEFIREYVSNPKALETIKSFSCTPTIKNLEYLTEYSVNSPKLEEFGFHLEKSYALKTPSWIKIASSFNLILKSSSDTMKRIVYFHPLGFLQHGVSLTNQQVEQIEFPIMKVLESIEFGEKSSKKCPHVLRKHNEMFSSLKEFQMTRQLFPSLKKISFCFSKVKTESFLIKYFKNFLITPVLMDELEIEISQQIPDSVVEQLVVLFPFVQGLSIKNVTDFHALGKSIFKHLHQNLTSLKLSGNILQSCFTNGLSSLDSTITGIKNPKVCDRLKIKLEEDAGSSKLFAAFLDSKSDSTNESNDDDDNNNEVMDNLQTSSEILNMKEFPSIRDMKKLKTFILELSEVSTMAWFLPHVDAFSLVTDAYGFSLMPLLEIKIILKNLPSENRAEFLKSNHNTKYHGSLNCTSNLQSFHGNLQIAEFQVMLPNANVITED